MTNTPAFSAGARRIGLRPLALALASALTLGAAAGSPTFASGTSSVIGRTSRAPRIPAMHDRSAAERNLPGTIRPSGDTVLVINCNDSGPGSLRDVAGTAVDGEIIDLTSLPCSTITLTSGAIFDHTDQLTLNGPGADFLTIDGGNVDNVLRHIGASSLTVAGITVTHGRSIGVPGGCIYSSGNLSLVNARVSACSAYSYGLYSALGGGVYAKSDLLIDHSTISGNEVYSLAAHSYAGGAFARGSLNILYGTVSSNTASGLVGNTGGVASTGDVYIRNSTFFNNQADYNAGLALFGNYASGPLRIRSTTISGNFASQGIGGIGVNRNAFISNTTITNNDDGGGFAAGLFLGATAQAELQSTIVAGNFSNATQSDVGGGTGAALTGANNLIMTSGLAVPGGTLSSDPMLGPLQDNGGATLTHALGAGSPAINAGSQAYEGIYDQRGRGFAAIVGANADIGAYEYQSTGVTHTVTQCADSGSGSLRDAFTHAASGDTIDLRSLTCGTITLTSGALEVPGGNLNLLGPGADLLTVDGHHADRVIEHLGDGTLYVSGMTLANGTCSTGNGCDNGGGCIYSHKRVSLEASVITGCELSGDDALLYGGAVAANVIALDGSTIAESRITGTNGHGYGAGVSAFDLRMTFSTIRDNQIAVTGSSGAGVGGGISASSVSMYGSTVSGNAATFGGGIVSSNDAFGQAGTRIVNSTISGNSGGGLFVGGLLQLYNSTTTLNTVGYAAPGGAGLLLYGNATLQSSIVSGNSGPAGTADIDGQASSLLIGANNLIGVSVLLVPADTIDADPLLGPLQDNGGLTFTHALQPGSPAIDAGNNLANLDDDQRGYRFPRVAGAAADIGAFELQDVIFADWFDPPD